jgi:hypothetical protein
MAIPSRERYDSKSGITAMLGSLADFNELLRLRFEAGYSRREMLTEFYLFGRWHMDVVGNTSKIVSEFIPKDQFPDMPDVLTRHEFWELVRGRYGKNMVVMSTSEAHIPPVKVSCAECSRPWCMANCHDFIPSRNYGRESFDLSNYVGMMVKELRDHLVARSDAVYRLDVDRPVGSAHSGWLGKKEGVTEHYRIVEGDRGHLVVWDCFHKACYRQYLERTQREDFSSLFANAGYHVFPMKAVPNQYSSHERSTPWFEVHTAFGVILIGWRKHVIHLDWSATGIDAPVPGENVTCGLQWTHAHGRDKGIEYLRKIRLAAEAKTKA